jgi:hypothetical protein
MVQRPLGINSGFPWHALLTNRITCQSIDQYPYGLFLQRSSMADKVFEKKLMVKKIFVD